MSQAATWLLGHNACEMLTPILIDWGRISYGPRPIPLRDDASIAEARATLRQGLLFAESHPDNIEVSPSFAGMNGIGWSRDEFWRFAVDRGIKIDVERFGEISACPSFLHSEYRVAIAAPHPADKGKPTSQGLRAEYENRTDGYIEYGAAVALLARVEGVSFSFAAGWLIEKEAHRRIPTFIRDEHSHPRHPGYLPYTVPSDNLHSERYNGPLCILEAIRMLDNVWWSSVGETQKSIDALQRWKREDFWHFAIANGASIRANSADADPISSSTEAKARAATPNEPSIDRVDDFYRGTDKEWRERALQAERRVHVLEQEIDILRADMQNGKHRISDSGDAINSHVPSLPHMTRNMTALFEVMVEFWSSYDARHPPKSTVIAAALDEKLGWRSQANGEPSRNAQTLAALIRPDELSQADGRNIKRRT